MRAEAPSSRAADAEAQGRRRLVSEAAALLLRAAAPERRHVGQAVAWLLLAAGLEALGPLAGKYFIDRYLLPRDADLGRMAALLLGALAAGMVASWLRYGQLVRLAGVAMRSVQRIREGVYAHVLRLPMAFFDHAVIGQLVSRVTNDTEAVKTLYVQVLFVILDSLIILAGAMAAMLWLDWRLMLVVAALVPAVVLIVVLYQRLSAPAVTRTRELRSELNAQLAESIAGMPVLQAANATARFQGRFAALNDAHYRSRLGELRANAWLLRPVLDFLNVLLLAVVLGVFGLRAGAQGLSALQVGILYAFISYISRVVEPLIQITMQFSQLQQALVAAARVHTLLAEAETPPAADQGRIARGEIAIEGLSFAYLPGGRCCTTSTCSWRPAVSTGSWVTPAAARARCWRCCCASTRRRQARSASTACRWRPSPRRAFAPAWAWCRRIPSCWRPARARTSRSGGRSATRRSRPRRARRTRTASSARWNAATTPSWARGARACPPARSSCWPSPERSPGSRASCCWTRPRPTSTRKPSRWCSGPWANCAAA